MSRQFLDRSPDGAQRHPGRPDPDFAALNPGYQAATSFVLLRGEATGLMRENEVAPVTPGEMLKEEFLAAYGLSQNRLAKAIGISPNRIAEIVNNRRRITADTALRLSLYFRNSPEFWMNLQAHYDLKMARRNLKPEDAKRIKASRAA